MPGYPAARAFAEMRAAAPGSILHLVHPRATPWRTLLTPIADALGVPLVPYAQWLTALEHAGAGGGVEAMRANPALRLLDFFRARAVVRPGCEALGTAILATEGACAASATLREMPPLGETEARRWVEAWKASGFLQ